MLVGRPEAVADAGLGTPGPSGALFGGSAGNTPGVQSGHAGDRIEGRFAAQAGVDHHPHSLDGQTGLGNRCGQHHLAPPGCGRGNGLALGGKVQFAIQRSDIHLWLIGQRLFQPGLQPTDLRRTGQKHQQAAAIRGQRLLHQLLQRRLDRLAGCQRRTMLDLHRILAALAGHQRCILQQATYCGSVQGGGHHQQLQRVAVITQVLLSLQTQGQAQIRIQTAFVKFVEDHQPDAGQLRIGLQQALQYALGHHLDAGGRADAGFQTDTVADGLPHRLAEQLRQPFGSGPGGQSARLQQDDLLPGQPVTAQQCQWHQGGLAGTGRCLQHHTGMAGQLLIQFGQHRLYRKLAHRHSHIGQSRIIPRPPSRPQWSGV